MVFGLYEFACAYWGCLIAWRIYRKSCTRMACRRYDFSYAAPIPLIVWTWIDRLSIGTMMCPCALANVRLIMQSIWIYYRNRYMEIEHLHRCALSCVMLNCSNWRNLYRIRCTGTVYDSNAYECGPSSCWIGRMLSDTAYICIESREVRIMKKCLNISSIDDLLVRLYTAVYANVRV